jgi:hypothetical protein
MLPIPRSSRRSTSEGRIDGIAGGDALENGTQIADLGRGPATGEMFALGENGVIEKDSLEGEFGGTE